MGGLLLDEGSDFLERGVPGELVGVVLVVNERFSTTHDLLLGQKVA